jgi:hypothetical protein
MTLLYDGYVIVVIRIQMSSGCWYVKHVSLKSMYRTTLIFIRKYWSVGSPDYVNIKTVLTIFSLDCRLTSIYICRLLLCSTYLRTDNQNSFVYENPWMWLTGAETCGRVYFFVITQFKYFSDVSAYCWNCLSKFIIFFRDRGTGPHFESNECSVRLPPPSPLTNFLLFIINFNTLLSRTRTDKLRVVVQFCKTFLLFRPSVCVLNIVAIPLLKHFVCTFVSRVET